MVVVVLVESETELLGGVAHAVRAVLAGGTIMVDAGAGVLVEAADGAEEVAVIVLAGAGADDAREGGLHAGAELLIRGGRERGRLGGPVGLHGRAGGRAVGRVVGIHLHAGRRDLGELGLQVVVVGEGSVPQVEVEVPGADDAVPAAGVEDGVVAVDGEAVDA